ncbi:hypothetical protein [Streptomyces sp. ST2-7A]|uniref:hypothetical protein n=1 Tax=Streptomyces sp. ST2-7A TaxID=2907214 RepID=UPI001F1E6BB7|nr:hypothetical protein [Streptomyces sp. ST2-7A]MCE7082133.1 hypothetical protein [Streptomyces sp. ST2-7A]
MNDEEMNKLRMRKLKILSEYHEEEKRRRDKLGAELAEIEQAMARVAESSLSMPCFVRATPGPKQTVYHSADATCDRVRDRNNYTPCTEHAALEELGPGDYYLRRCTACDWEKAAHLHAQRDSPLRVE